MAAVSSSLQTAIQDVFLARNQSTLHRIHLQAAVELIQHYNHLLKIAVEPERFVLSKPFFIQGKNSDEIFERALAICQRQGIIITTFMAKRKVFLKQARVITSDFENYCNQYDIARNEFNAPSEKITKQDFIRHLKHFQYKLSKKRVAIPEKVEENPFLKVLKDFYKSFLPNLVNHRKLLSKKQKTIFNHLKNVIQIDPENGAENLKKEVTDQWVKIILDRFMKIQPQISEILGVFQDNGIKTNVLQADLDEIQDIYHEINESYEPEPQIGDRWLGEA